MSLKKNFLYNSILTVSTYLFPLIVYPYASRTLGVSNIGIVNFIDNFVNYFMYLSMMGIATMGVREIASVKNDRKTLSHTFMSLLTLTAITTAISIAALWIAIVTVDELKDYQDMLYVGIIKLVFNLLLIEWFYTGMEDFKYITNRSIIVKTLYVLSVFIFVKEASDYKIFYMLLVGAVAVNAIINIIHCRRYVNFSLQNIDIRPFYKAFLIMGVYVLVTNVYTSLNAVWLGFVTDTDQVGYFTTATKLHILIMAFLLSFSNILFPRVSNLLAEGKKAEFWEKITIAFDAIFLFAFPTMAFMLVAGPELLHFVVGDGFEGSYLPLRIITPLVLIIGIEQILVIQILMAMHQDGIVLRNSIMGALSAMAFNILLTSAMGASGSAVAWVIAEFVIMALSMAYIYRKYHYMIPYQRIFAYLATYTPLLLILLIIYSFIDNQYAMIGLTAASTIVYAFFCETFLLKNKVARQLLQATHILK